MTSPTLPQWLIYKNAARAHTAPAKPIGYGLVKTAHVKRTDKPILRVDEIECFDSDLPSYENHSDDCTEGLDTLEFSLSID